MSPGPTIQSRTRFTQPSAVELWDREIRWREEGGPIRDRSIESTWTRLTDALGRAEGEDGQTWREGAVSALRQWRILPDEVLLREAGTGRALALPARPAAVVNAAAFVTTGGSAPVLRFTSMQAHAAMAVRMLDNAVQVYSPDRPPEALAIGLIGVGTALRRLHIGYESVAAARIAGRMARALATGALAGSAALAAERGARAEVGQAPEAMALALKSGMPEELRKRVLRHGLRYARLTEVRPHPLLAGLADRVSDALDPDVFATVPQVDESLPRWLARCRALAAEVNLRCHVQPWIDQPIDYPTRAMFEPGNGLELDDREPRPSHQGLS